MNLPPRTSLAVALSLHLGGEDDTFDSALRLREDLGLDPLDLALIALRLEEEACAEFPLACLDAARTVADLDDIVDGWLAEQRTRVH